MKKKPLIIMLVSVGILFGSIIIYKAFINFMIHKFLSSMQMISTVSSTKAEYSTWLPHQKYYGQLRAVQGVNVTTELAGMVSKIYFQSGQMVKQGQILVQLNAAQELGLLQATQANKALAAITLRRDTAQYAIHAISKQILDNDKANYKNLAGQVAEQQAIVDKKTIRAPFSGRIGISTLQVGQYLNTGDTVAPLQRLDHIFADFYVPQQELFDVKVGQAALLHVDNAPKTNFTGKVTAINTIIDNNTRNVLVEATFNNPNLKLAPGVFGSITIETGGPQKFITLPQTAVVYNPYGDVIYTLKPSGKDKKGRDIYTVAQKFVTTGLTRGDQVAILKGINLGEEVVTSGQMKLDNGSKVVINNSVQPDNNPDPKVKEK